MEYSNIPKTIGRKENNPTPHLRIIGLYVTKMITKITNAVFVTDKLEDKKSLYIENGQTLLFKRAGRTVISDNLLYANLQR